jgi:hypothetical protein
MLRNVEMKPMKFSGAALIAGALIFGGIPTMAHVETAYLEITLNVATADRPPAAAIYQRYKQPFLTKVKGAVSKQLLVRDEDVQVLHGFGNVADARAYLTSELFEHDVVKNLKPLLKSAPEVRIYSGD